MPPVVVLAKYAVCPASMSVDEGVSDVTVGSGLTVTEPVFDAVARPESCTVNEYVSVTCELSEGSITVHVTVEPDMLQSDVLREPSLPEKEVTVYGPVPSEIVPVSVSTWPLSAEGRLVDSEDNRSVGVVTIFSAIAELVLPS
jgi:hypothetical protein